MIILCLSYYHFYISHIYYISNYKFDIFVLYSILYYYYLTYILKKEAQVITTTVSSRGQVILPSKLRKKNEIKKGMKFTIEVENKKIILIPIDRNYFERLSGSISTKKGSLLEALSREKEREKRL